MHDVVLRIKCLPSAISDSEPRTGLVGMLQIKLDITLTAGFRAPTGGD